MHRFDTGVPSGLMQHMGKTAGETERLKEIETLVNSKKQ